VVPKGSPFLMFVEHVEGGCSSWPASATWRALSPSTASARTRWRTATRAG
jgi:hypothetical protein